MVVLMEREQGPTNPVPNGTGEKRVGPVGRRVRERRHALGMSQDDLVRSSGLSKTYIGQLENGGVSHPRSDTIHSLSVGLEVSEAWLLTGSDQSSEYPIWARKMGEFRNPSNELWVKDLIKRLQTMERMEELGFDPDGGSSTSDE